MVDEISVLAEEALKIQKRIKEDTVKLRKIKDKLIEKSREKNDSFTISLDEGSVRMMKYKDQVSYKLNEKAFDELDQETKSKLLKENYLKLKVSINNRNFKEAYDNNLVPIESKQIVEIKDKKPFAVTIYS
tara:strand:+ start:89 stop:481 length:393 start_codon:yes stop_codon:yes gene_type:complete